jgi:Uma2 family endonuclease
LHFRKREYIVGPPLVGVEFRSPGDESYEKLPFYASLGVPEVWIIDRDAKSPEIFHLVNTAYESVVSNPEGWVRSSAVGDSSRRRKTRRAARRAV